MKQVQINERYSTVQVPSWPFRLNFARVQRVVIKKKNEKFISIIMK